MLNSFEPHRDCYQNQRVFSSKTNKKKIEPTMTRRCDAGMQRMLSTYIGKILMKDNSEGIHQLTEPVETEC